LKVRGTWLAVFLLGICGCVTADQQQIEGLKTELLTFSDWQISKTRFCPEEPVVIFARVTNTINSPLDLRLISGDSNRALVRISDSSGAVVWDTDEWDSIEEERHVEQHGMGRIFAGPSVYNMTLDSGASVFWISRWEQRNLAGEYVDEGEYLIEVAYRWLRLSDEEDRTPIQLGPAKILISGQRCE